MASEKALARAALQEKLYRLSSNRKNAGAAALSRALNITKSKAEAWFKGRTFPSEDLQPMIAAFYGVTVDQLFDMDNPDIFDFSKDKAERIEEAALAIKRKEFIDRILKMNPKLTLSDLEENYNIDNIEDLRSGFLENGNQKEPSDFVIIPLRSNTSEAYDSLGRKPPYLGTFGEDLKCSPRKKYIRRCVYLMLHMDQERFDKVLDFIVDITDDGRNILKDSQ